MRGFDEARAAGGHFCLATHYWEVDRHAEAGAAAVPRSTPPVFPDVQFVAVERLFEPMTPRDVRALRRARTARRYRDAATTSSKRSARITQLIAWLGEVCDRFDQPDRRARPRLRHRPLLLGSSQGEHADRPRRVGADARRSAPSDSRPIASARGSVTLVKGDLATHQFRRRQLRPRLLDRRAGRARAR